jgi:hypothetical protein
MADLLPDCRSRTPRGVALGVAGLWEPVFCANCGADGGLVPAENMTFLFYLCNTCAETYGQIAGLMLMPDEVFFAKLAEAQLERYGRYLTPMEWAAIGEDPSHPLWTLLKEQPQGRG